MKIKTVMMKAFIEEMAHKSAQASDIVSYEDAVEEFTKQVEEDDAAWLVRFALDSGVYIPKELKKFVDEAKSLY